jgi:hypothetical protein
MVPQRITAWGRHDGLLLRGSLELHGQATALQVYMGACALRQIETLVHRMNVLSMVANFDVSEETTQTHIDASALFQ